MQQQDAALAVTDKRAGRPRLASRAAWIAAGVAALALAAPALASADQYLGSTLSPAATVAEAFQQDTTFWSTAIPAHDAAGATSAIIPQDGQILQFQLRGFAGGGFGPQPIFFQVLRPNRSGGLTVVATSQAFMLPATNGVWGFDPSNFCVRAGDVLGFSDEGGFQLAPNGVPFQVFGQSAGAQTQHFTKDRGVQNGATLTPEALPPGVELLMAAYEGTGAHASPLCGGIQGIDLMPPGGSAKVGANGTTTLSIGCAGPLPCNGTLSLSLPSGHSAATKHKKKKSSSSLGRAHFKIPSHHTSKVKVRLTKRARRLLRSHHGRLKVVLALSSGAGGAANTVTSTLTLSG